MEVIAMLLSKSKELVQGPHNLKRHCLFWTRPDLKKQLSDEIEQT